MHTVRFSRSGEECNAEDGQTILDVAEEHGISFKHGCTNGACNLCLCTVKKGIEHVLHKRTRSPFADAEKVLACLATIRGNIEVIEPIMNGKLPGE